MFWAHLPREIEFITHSIGFNYSILCGSSNRPLMLQNSWVFVLSLLFPSRRLDRRLFLIKSGIYTGYGKGFTITLGEPLIYFTCKDTSSLVLLDGCADGSDTGGYLKGDY